MILFSIICPLNKKGVYVMKKSLVLLMALGIICAGSAQAAQGPVSKWLSDTADKIEQKEDAAYKKMEANKKASEARQQERQKAIEEQKQAIKERQEAREEAIKKQQEAIKQRQEAREEAREQYKKEMKAKQEARQKKIETKKQQWKDLLSD